MRHHLPGAEPSISFHNIIPLRRRQRRLIPLPNPSSPMLDDSPRRLASLTRAPAPRMCLLHFRHWLERRPTRLPNPQPYYSTLCPVSAHGAPRWNTGINVGCLGMPLAPHDSSPGPVHTCFSGDVEACPMGCCTPRIDYGKIGCFGLRCCVLTGPCVARKSSFQGFRDTGAHGRMHTG
jgi:hypothetical protein